MPLKLQGERFMEKSMIKKYIVNISLIVILFASGFFAVYSIVNYKSSGNNTGSFGNMQGSGGGPQSGGNKQGIDNQQSGDVPQMPDNQQNSTWQQGGNMMQGGSQQGGKQQNGGGGQSNRSFGVSDSSYALPLTIYSAIFFIVCASVFYLAKTKKIKFNFDNEKIMMFILIAVGLLLRLGFSTKLDGHNDLNLFKSWASTAANALTSVYSGGRGADYPPFYIYILAIIGKLATISPFSNYYVVLLKLPAMIADVVTAVLIYKISKKNFNGIISFLLAAFYMFNPAIFIDSTFWGQVDSFFTLMIVISIYLVTKNKIVPSSIAFAASILMKPQGIIFLPVLFYELVRQKNIKKFIIAAVSAVATAIIIILPFSISQGNPLWIFNLYTSTIGEYPYGSVNAFNFFGLIGGNYNSSTAYNVIGFAFIVITSLVSWLFYIKRNDVKFAPAAALLQIAGVFTFSNGMHERYLFPAVALAILAYVYLKDKRIAIIAIGFSITNFVNITSVLFNTSTSLFNALLQVFSIVNIGLTIFLVKVLYDNSLKKNQTL